MNDSTPEVPVRRSLHEWLRTPAWVDMKATLANRAESEQGDG